MFWSSVGRDFYVIGILLIIVLIMTLFIYLKTKKKLLSFFSFSFLANLVFWSNAGAKVFSVYNLKWFIKFTLWYWPYINLALFALLIIIFFKNKYAKK